MAAPFRRRKQAAALGRLSARTTTISSQRRSGFALTSSAARLDVADRSEAKVQRMLRQGWQADAWNFRDAVAELRYAVNFLANCSARMRLYPACYPMGGEADNPLKLEDVPGLPEMAISAASQAMSDLGNGRTAISGMLHSASTNKTIAGESYLLGRTDLQTDERMWSIRSVDELVVYGDQWHLREIPDDRENGIIPWIPLDPNQTVISRIWTPHPRFQLLADSPLRAMLDDLESLGILRRMIRATGRSRLASRGLLLMPEGLSIKSLNDDNDDPNADEFMDSLFDAMMAPVISEGTADGVVPIVVRGPGDELAKVRLLDMAQGFDEQASRTRAELIGIVATGLDLPKEIIMGVADLNHWSAWQVDDNTFRHHVEPHVIGLCDDFSAGFLRPYLIAAGVPEQWAQRMVLWYDPTELVTHPDRAKDAQTAYDAMALSGEALRAAYGFSEQDKPSVQELETRRVLDIRALPLNLLMELASRMDPTLIVPPMIGPPEVPGIKVGGGVDIREAPLPGGVGGTPPGADAGTGPAVSVPATPDEPGPPAGDQPIPAPPSITASAGPATRVRLSRKLASIDRDLRSRLQTAANAEVQRALERAGAKVRTKVAKDETSRTLIAQRSNQRVPAILGRDVVTAAGITDDDLISGEWAGLRSQFYTWTEAAQAQALATALKLGELEVDSSAAARAEAAMAAGRDAAWTLLSSAMTSLSRHLLYNPDPNVSSTDWADLNPDTLVPAGTIRAALAVAGGANSSAAVLTADTGAVATSGYVGQIGTGATVSDLLSSTGLENNQFEWVHGPSLRPFEPHEDLDGVQFPNFDDDSLANTDGFPANLYFFPGDHDGCLCDAMPLWDFPGNPMTSDQE